ncbi:hypothetical protein IAU59_007573 [Kwoniella sp. CBS 9459]
MSRQPNNAPVSLSTRTMALASDLSLSKPLKRYGISAQGFGPTPRQATETPTTSNRPAQRFSHVGLGLSDRHSPPVQQGSSSQVQPEPSTLAPRQHPPPEVDHGAIAFISDLSKYGAVSSCVCRFEYQVYAEEGAQHSLCLLALVPRIRQSSSVPSTYGHLGTYARITVLTSSTCH